MVPGERKHQESGRGPNLLNAAKKFGGAVLVFGGFALGTEVGFTFFPEAGEFDLFLGVLGAIAVYEVLKNESKRRDTGS